MQRQNTNTVPAPAADAPPVSGPAAEPSSALPDGEVAALEPATLPSHPLRAMDVPGLIPKTIG